MAIEILASCVAALLLVAALAVAAGHRPRVSGVVYAACLLVCSVALITALGGLLGGTGATPTLQLPLGLPWIGVRLRLDALAAFFLVIVNLGGAAASLYAIGYGMDEANPRRVLPFFAAFLAGMNVVVLADDAFSFLFSWEFMSLSSWALVVSHHEQRANLRAGYVYLLMASFGTLALLLAFGLLAGDAGHYDFAAIRSAGLAAPLPALVLVLALLGAGSKAGIVPLHAWLPLAHPAAPSHVSALMSGVMTKVAIYGFIRIVFDLVGQPSWWSSTIVLVLGGITAAMGVLYALMQHELKRLLAYHTVENIGIIFIGLGLALAFQAYRQQLAAALAMTAALLHVFNHSLFKSLLFFGAGAVLRATGERDMERFGGLIHRMPITSLLFLVGCAAISALPPLNGFVSEWLTFQAVLQSPQLPHWGLKVIVPAVGTLLALSAALAGACFVKAYGISFLGRPRGPAAAQAREVDRCSLAGMLLLALCCVLAGILPGYFMDALAPAVSGLLGSSLAAQAKLPWLTVVPIDAGRSSYNGMLVFLFIAASASLGAYLLHRFASQAVRRAPAWDCGFPDADPATQYTAGSFAQPIRRVFGSTVFQAREQVQMPPPGTLAPAVLRVQIRDLVWDFAYAPLAATINRITGALNGLQFLTIRRYLSLVFVALVTLLLVLTIWH